MRSRYHCLSCVYGMWLIDQSFAKMLLALSAGSPDLLMPVYTIGGTVFARPCKECNPEWNIPDSWRVATVEDLRRWAEGHDA